MSAPLDLDAQTKNLSLKDRRIWKRFCLKGGVLFGDKYFSQSWRIHRVLIYLARKERGLPDPLDVFDDFKGPIFKKEVK